MFSLADVFLTMIYSWINQNLRWVWTEGDREQGKGACALWEPGMFISIHDLKRTQVFSFSTSNILHLVSTTKMEAITPLPENRKSWSLCKPFLTGLNYCINGAYSNASSTDSPYYPLTGDTRSDGPAQHCSPFTLWSLSRAKKKCYVL